MKFDKLVDAILLEASVIKKSHLYTPFSSGENIIAAAIKDKKTGNVYTGDSHYDAFFVMHTEEGYDFRYMMKKRLNTLETGEIITIDL